MSEPLQCCLCNVGSSITNDRLVLQLVFRLTDAYTHVGTHIRHGDSLPMFYKARSMLVLEETTRSKRIEPLSESFAFLATYSEHSGDNSVTGKTRNNHPRGGGRNGDQ